MNRRNFLAGVGSNVVLLGTGCLGTSDRSDDTRNGGDADGMADEFTFEVVISGVPDYIEITGEPVKPPLEKSRGKMELQVTNLTDTDLVPANESRFFPSKFILTPSNSIEELRFTRDGNIGEPKTVPANNSVVRTYTAEFALYLLDRVFETDYEIQYQYEQEEVEANVSMEITTEILTMDRDSMTHRVI